MSEVVKLQLIGLSVIGVGIVILLFVRAQFARVIGVRRDCPGPLLARGSGSAADGVTAAGRGKIRHCHRQDADRHGGDRPKDFLQQGSVRAVPFHRSERIGSLSRISKESGPNSAANSFSKV